MQFRLDSFHGVLLLYKERGYTSHSAVFQLRQIFKQKAVGHAGTLDSEAEGLLLMLLGEGTKISSYLLGQDKRYRLKIKFGLVTETLDLSGKVLKEDTVFLEEGRIREAIKNHEGTLKISVPKYSAVKVQGKRLSSYMREGNPIPSPLREMRFYNLKVLHIGDDEAEVEISCTKGSYIRSWVYEIGKSLSVGASLVELVRIRSEPFSVEDSISLSNLERPELLNECENPEQSLSKSLSSLERLEPFEWTPKLLKTSYPQAFRSLREALPGIEEIPLTRREARSLSEGQISGFLIQRTLENQKQVNQKKRTRFLR